MSANLVARPLSSDGLTAQRSSFDRRDAVRAVAAASQDWAMLGEIESFVDGWLGNGEVVTLAAPGAPAPAAGCDPVPQRPPRICARRQPEALDRGTPALDQRVTAEHVASIQAGAGIAACEAVDQTITRRPTLGADQESTIRRLARDGAGIQIVVVPPGTGETFALAAAREAWEASSFMVAVATCEPANTARRRLGRAWLRADRPPSHRA